MKLTKLASTSAIPTLIIRLTVGLTFLSEGIQKFLFPAIDGAGRFAKIGFSNPSFWASFAGIFEIACGMMVILGFYTRLSTVPLLCVMAVAFITTKYPLLIEKGFWQMAHEYRTDFAMTMLLIFLILHGGGKLSFDKWFFNKKEK